MSILNVVLTPDFALIGTDTASGAIDGSAPGQISKCIAFPHINAALAGRGNAFFLMAMVVAANMSNSVSLDALVDTMPKLLRECFDLYIQQAVQSGVIDDPTIMDPQMIALVGWSSAKRRMIGRHYGQETREQGFSEDEIELGAVAPSDESLESLYWELEAYKTREAMEKLAHAQVKFTKDANPNLPVGGRLMLTTIRKDGIFVTPGCYLTPTPMALGKVSLTYARQFSSDSSRLDR